MCETGWLLDLLIVFLLWHCNGLFCASVTLLYLFPLSCPVINLNASFVFWSTSFFNALIFSNLRFTFECSSSWLCSSIQFHRQCLWSRCDWPSAEIEEDGPNWCWDSMPSKLDYSDLYLDSNSISTYQKDHLVWSMPTRKPIKIEFKYLCVCVCTHIIFPQSILGD